MDFVTKKRQRSQIFRLLSACFYEPDKKLFMEELVCTNLANLLAEVAPEAESAALNMQAALSETDDKEMLLDYARLFVGPFELLAPPYGSIYIEGKSQVMGDSTMAVLKKYQEIGLSIDIKEPADHIAFELEFMHYLYTLETEAIQKDDNAKTQSLASMRNDFLSAYLTTWIPQFCEKIRIGTDNMFYRNLADCLELFIELEVSSQLIVNVNGATEHAYQPSTR